MTTTTNTQQIYIACLASYNQGMLHGAWVECNQDYDDFYDDVKEVMNTSPVGDAEEWAIHDYSGFGGIKINEYDSINHIWKLAEALGELDENQVLLFEYLYDNYGDDLDSIKEKMEEVYIFEGSRADYAEELTEECCCEIPQHLQNYIDYDAMGRDMEYEGELVELEHNVFITNANSL